MTDTIPIVEITERNYMSLKIFEKLLSHPHSRTLEDITEDACEITDKIIRKNRKYQAILNQEIKEKISKKLYPN